MATPDPGLAVPVSEARERILEAAYGLFSRQGIAAVGVDTIVAEAGVAKMTLYRHFPSKADLALAFLERREERWTREWLQVEAVRRGSNARERLLAIFDVFGEWFAEENFEGCSFVNILLEIDDRDDQVRQASVKHLANIRDFVCGLADEAGVADPEALAAQWHILMKGSIVAAGEGDLEAARRAQDVGALLLERELAGRARLTTGS
jgi:AcrR family transcriptional regulator